MRRMTTPELGLIEGFYGRPWTWAERRAVMERLSSHGFGFHTYAPKGDAFLRRRWREPHPDAEAQAMRDFAAACRARGVRFGVGLSPYEVYLDFDPGAREALGRKLDLLDQAGVQDLAILFDDMRGDIPDLAARQVEVAHFAAERTGAQRLIVCPVYYSDDPVLDRVFGQRPQGWLEDFGARLDLAIGVFWTGEEVCSREYSSGHLERVCEQLRRKPVLWDNYPVNDGPVMSRRLHLRAFTGRPSSLGRHVAGHAINPAMQPTLSCIPALTLAESYRLGEAYAYGGAFMTAAAQIVGRDLAEHLRLDMHRLQDVGLDLSPERAARLRARYAAIDEPAAREVVAWLDGAYLTPDVTTDSVADTL